MSKWIPCSERLPEEDEGVLATDGRNIWIDTFWLDEDGDPHFFYQRFDKVKAWMPLPDPPEGDDNDE